jgi:hypothetical protein
MGGACIAYKGEMKNAQKILWENRKVGDLLGDVRVDETIILKLISKK